MTEEMRVQDKPLEKKSQSPLYQQLMTRLKNDILAGVYPSGARIPSEQLLCETYGVSRVTVRKAMLDLVQEGLLVRRQGKGTFVTSPKYGRDYTHIQGFSESCLARGLKPGARLLQKEIVAPKSSILESLGLDENSQTVKIVRLRYVNDEPMVIETSYFPLDYAFLLQENLDGSLFQVLREKKDLVIDGSKKIVEICRATTEEARWLKLRKNAPLLLVRSVAFGNAGQPVYVCMQVINGERFQLIL